MLRRYPAWSGREEIDDISRPSRPVLPRVPVPVLIAGVLVASVLGAGILGAGVLVGGGAVAATAPRGVSVSGGWLRAITPAVPAGGYFTLRNGGPNPVTLTGAASPGCGELMLHRTESAGGVDTMQMVDQVVVPPGGTLHFAPGGYHLMCMGERLTVGTGVPVTLRFADGSAVTTSFAVENATGTGPATR